MIGEDACGLEGKEVDAVREKCANEEVHVAVAVVVEHDRRRRVVIVLGQPDLRGDVFEPPVGRLPEHAAQAEAVHIEVETAVVVVVHPAGAGAGRGFGVQGLEAGAGGDIGENGSRRRSGTARFGDCRAR